MNYREKMRKYLKEPNEICNHYGKWEILNKEQRDLITRLLNEIDRADNYIKKIQQENEQLKDNWNKLKYWLDDEIKNLKHTKHWDVKRKIQEIEEGSDSKWMIKN